MAARWITVPALLGLALAACAPRYVQPGTALAERDDFAASRPRLHVEDELHWSAGFEAAYTVARRNLHAPTSFHRGRHARAAPAIRGVHLWDSAFLSHVWRAWDVEIAQEINRVVLDHARDGRLPHFSHRVFRSRLTQPPVIAWSVWENFERSADTAYLAAVYPVLVAYDVWLRQNRQLESGLFFWAAPFESGMDNSPRFDAGRGRRQRDLREIAAVDLSSYVALQSSVLGRIAEVLADAEGSRRHEDDAQRLRSSINQLLWDDEAGLYFDRHEPTGERVRVATAASLLPLFGMVPDSARAARLRDHIMDPGRFNSPIPLPTVARDEGAFSSDMWRGPVWINVSFMIIRGLAAYGYHDEAADLAFATADGVFRTHAQTGGVWEFYDPTRFDISRLQRKRGELVKRMTLGNRPLPDYGWSALANALVVEYLVGYQRHGATRSLTPRLPARAAGMRLELVLPGEEVRIAMESLADGRIQGHVLVGSDRIPFLLASGEPLLLPNPQDYAQEPPVPVTLGI